MGFDTIFHSIVCEYESQSRMALLQHPTCIVWLIFLIEAIWRFGFHLKSEFIRGRFLSDGDLRLIMSLFVRLLIESLDNLTFIIGNLIIKRFELLTVGVYLKCESAFNSLLEEKYLTEKRH